jgi:very-short-patch-repair endonuclease
MDRYASQTAGKRWWRKLKPEGQRMRHEPTPAENALWQALRNGKLGVRFRRQHAIERFIVDFICLPAKLIVEVDGGIHESQVGRDEERGALLQSAGYEIVRFSNNMVLSDLESVLHDIRRRLTLRRSTKLPSPHGEGKAPPEAGQG